MTETEIHNTVRALIDHLIILRLRKDEMADAERSHYWLAIKQIQAECPHNDLTKSFGVPRCRTCSKRMPS